MRFLPWFAGCISLWPSCRRWYIVVRTEYELYSCKAKKLKPWTKNYTYTSWSHGMHDVIGIHCGFMSFSHVLSPECIWPSHGWCYPLRSKVDGWWIGSMMQSTCSETRKWCVEQRFKIREREREHGFQGVHESRFMIMCRKKKKCLIELTKSKLN